MGSSTGSSEQYCLRWNDFESNITAALSELRADESLLDVTLVAANDPANRGLRAHRLVLSACSPLFRKWLRKNAHPNPMILLHGVKYDEIAALLNFMYHGEVNVDQEDLQGFLSAAEELRIRGLSDRSTGGGTNGAGNERAEKRSDSPAQTASAKKARISQQSPKKAMVVTPDIGNDEDTYDDDEEEENLNGSNNFDADAFEAGMNLYNASNGMNSGGRGSSSSSGGRSQQHHDSQYWGSSFTEQQQQQQFLQQQPRSTCPYCRKEMKNSHSLNVHISRYHNENSNNAAEVICPVCERKYGNKYSLRTHMHLNHKDQLHLLGATRRSGKKEKPDPSQSLSPVKQPEQSETTTETKEEKFFY